LQHPGNFNKAIRSPNHEETQMKKLFAKTLIAASLAGSAFVAQAQEVTLKVHHFLSPTTFIQVGVFEPWCAKLAKESNNRIKCQIYPAMQLGGTPPQLYDQAKDGVADIVWTVPGYAAGRFPLSQVFELPFTMTNAEATSRAAWEFVQAHGQQEFKDVHLLAAHVHGPGVMFTTKKQMKSMDDFKGMKFRAPTPLTNKMLAMLGATPVGMPVPAIPEALSKGVIEGAVIPYQVAPSLKVHELVKFAAETDPKYNGPLHDLLRGRDEQGQVRLVAGRPEEGDRQQLGYRIFGHGRPGAGSGRCSRTPEVQGCRRDHQYHPRGGAREVEKGYRHSRRRLGRQRHQARP
jgi:TRAP-type C4-dicarboxylate transport system substrate-binding protein